MLHILTQEESNDLNRCHKQIQFFGLGTNPAKIALYKPFKDEVDLLVATIGTIEGIEPAKVVDSKDITSGRRDLKVDFANFEGEICHEALAYAIRWNKPIKEAVRFRPDEIMKMKDTTILGFATGIKNTLNDYLADMAAKFYTVDLPGLMLGISKATLFNGTIGAAKVVQAGDTVAGGQIEEQFAIIDGIQEQFKLLRGHWKVSDHPFYEGILVSSVIDELGHHFTGLKGVVTGGPTNILLGDATIKNVRLDRSTGCNVLAAYEMKGMHAHLDNYLVECAGYHSLTEAFKTAKGEMLVKNFHLEPLV
jgi:hypothetical protein